MKTIAGDIPQLPRYATTEAEATHKFPAYVHWGDGYFGGMRHNIVADTDEAAYSVMRHRLAESDWHNLWKRIDGKWVNCADIKR